MAAKLEKTSTPGIYRRGARYVVVWRYRGRQHKSFHRTFAEAREAKGARDSGDRRPRTRANFAEYFEQWIESYAGRTQRGFSETTRPEYRRPIEQHALKRWGTWTLEDVEPADVRELFTDLRAKGATTSSLVKLRAALSAMFATAVEDNKVRSNPVRGVRIPQAADDDQDKQAKALTRQELSLLLAELPENQRLFFELLAHTGLRISEAIGLTWEHVELGAHPRLLVREQFYRGQRRRLKSKYGKRDVPLSAGMARRLAELRRDGYRGERAPVFAAATGTELHPSNIAGRVLKPAAIAAGLLKPAETWKDADKPESWVSFHTLRHTCASLLFEGGKNIKQVQEWLGHADPGFTLRTYVHLMDDGLGGADFLDEAVTALQPSAEASLAA